MRSADVSGIELHEVFYHRRHGRAELVVGAGGDLARVVGLEVSEKLLSGPELVGFEGSPRSLAILGDPCVKSATRLPDVKKSGVVVVSQRFVSVFIWFHGLSASSGILQVSFDGNSQALSGLE